MFGRKARRIAELEQELAALRETNYDLGRWLVGMEKRYHQLRQQVESAGCVAATADVAEPRPYVVWDPCTQPRQAPGTDRLTDTEAPVRPCEKCGQPHGVDQACAGEIREAA